MTRSPIKACSYEYLYEFATSFFEALRSCNIIVDAYFVDTLFDMDKVETVARRCESNQNRGKIIREAYDNDFTRPMDKKLANGMPHIRLCLFSIRDAVRDFLGRYGGRLCYGCKDPDRYLPFCSSELVARLRSMRIITSVMY